MNILNTLAALLVATSLSLVANAESMPNEFGFYLAKEQMRNVSRQSIEVKLCPHEQCEWQTLRTSKNVRWAIKSEPLSFPDYLEAFMKSQASDSHFIFVNRAEQQLLYTTLYGHREEQTRPAPPATTGEQ